MIALGADAFDAQQLEQVALERIVLSGQVLVEWGHRCGAASRSVWGFFPGSVACNIMLCWLLGPPASSVLPRRFPILLEDRSCPNHRKPPLPYRRKWSRPDRSRSVAEGQTRTKPKRQPPYHVILWDDQDHTHAYVIVMLQQLFGYPPTKGFQLADEVDRRGRAIVLTTTLEHAELKRDQIRAYGKDALNAECRARCTPRSSPRLRPRQARLGVPIFWSSPVAV